MAAKHRKLTEFFARIAELNKIIDKGGDEAKDALAAKARLAAGPIPKKKRTISKPKTKRRKTDLLDSRAMLPGSFGSGKQ